MPGMNSKLTSAFHYSWRSTLRGRLATPKWNVEGGRLQVILAGSSISCPFFLF
jgi:hypothetical protein